MKYHVTNMNLTTALNSVPGQRVDDQRGVLGKVQRVGEVVDALECWVAIQ